MKSWKTSKITGLTTALIAYIWNGKLFYYTENENIWITELENWWMNIAYYFIFTFYDQGIHILFAWGMAW
jgi:hypothetical protein